jgi:hypothetical protein
MIPSVAELDAFGLLYAAPSSPQVTMGCDHVLIPNALSAFTNGKELFPQFEIAMSETPRRLNLVPRVPLRSDGLELTRCCCGPGSRTISTSRASEHNGAAFCALESRWAKRRDGSVCRQVSPLDGRLKMFRDVAGPSFGAFSAVKVRGFAMFKDIKLSPYELPNAETSTGSHLSQLDRTTQICFELLELSLALNPGQLGSPEIPTISVAVNKTSPIRSNGN